MVVDQADLDLGGTRMTPDELVVRLPLIGRVLGHRRQRHGWDAYAARLYDCFYGQAESPKTLVGVTLDPGNRLGGFRCQHGLTMTFELPESCRFASVARQYASQHFQEAAVACVRHSADASSRPRSPVVQRRSAGAPPAAEATPCPTSLEPFGRRSATHPLTSPRGSGSTAGERQEDEHARLVMTRHSQ